MGTSRENSQPDRIHDSRRALVVDSAECGSLLPQAPPGSGYTLSGVQARVRTGRIAKIWMSVPAKSPPVDNFSAPVNKFRRPVDCGLLFYNYAMLPSPPHTELLRPKTLD